MVNLLIATKNPGKLAEISKMLEDYEDYNNFNLKSLVDCGIDYEVEETKDTFLDNAKLKAVTYASLSGWPTLADDSGLEIDALNGWPGVYSRRIFGFPKRRATDQEAIAEVLKRMQGVPWNKRTAHFTAAVALALPDGRVWTGSGRLNGYIAEQAETRIIPGYPYRSLYYLPDCGKISVRVVPEDGCDVGQHRRLALKALAPYLKMLK